MGKIRIVFDGPPGPESGRFVEVENEQGESICFGEWSHKGDYWYLSFPDHFAALTALKEKTEDDKALSDLLDKKVSDRICGFEEEIATLTARAENAEQALEELGY